MPGVGPAQGGVAVHLAEQFPAQDWRAGHRYPLSWS
jgi:hypothetical protein